MPTYDYECQTCGHKFEKFQSITAAPVRKCPACGKRKVKRLPGAGAGVIFRGEGFYQTDYRSSSYKKQAEKEKSPGKSESKPESDSKPSEAPKVPDSSPPPSPPPHDSGGEKGGNRDSR